jgi:predicted HTH transcriptional regulator
MTTDELEAHLDGQAETQTLDFKASCPWDALRFAKDILAFSNVRDGGLIVIGVTHETFAREGIQIASYADPHVNFGIEFPKDRNDTVYAVIRIEPFNQVPTICRKDGVDTQAGAIYYRNINRRIESSRVSNYHDMREIIEAATIRMMRRMQTIGFAPTSQDKPGPEQEDSTAKNARKEFLDELGGL